MLSSGASASEVAVCVQVLLATVRACGLGALLVTEGMDVLLLVKTFHVHHLHLKFGQNTILVITMDDHVGAVVVKLRCRVCGPREREQTLVRICARRHILGDLNGPFVVEVGAGLGVLADDMPCFATNE